MDDRNDIKKWLSLSEGNFTPDELKEEFSGSGDTEKVMNVIKIALKSKGSLSIRLTKLTDGNIDYKIDQD